MYKIQIQITNTKYLKYTIQKYKNTTIQNSRILYFVLCICIFVFWVFLYILPFVFLYFVFVYF